MKYLISTILVINFSSCSPKEREPKKGNDESPYLIISGPTEIDTRVYMSEIEHKSTGKKFILMKYLGNNTTLTPLN